MTTIPSTRLAGTLQYWAIRTLDGILIDFALASNYKLSPVKYLVETQKKSDFWRSTASSAITTLLLPCLALRSCDHITSVCPRPAHERSNIISLTPPRRPEAGPCGQIVLRNRSSDTRIIFFPFQSHLPQQRTVSWILLRQLIQPCRDIHSRPQRGHLPRVKRVCWNAPCPWIPVANSPRRLCFCG